MNPKENKIIERRNFAGIMRVFFKFFLNDTINAYILLLKKNKKYHFDKSKYIGINLGSSTDNPPRWIGISGGITIFLINLPLFFLRITFPFSKRSKKQSFREFHQKIKMIKVLHHNLFYGIPFKDNSVSNIFSSHFFEHLTYESAEFLFSESYRVLEPGGVIRILVPSLENEALKMKEALEAFDNGNIFLIQSFVTEPYEELVDPFSHHRYMYDTKALKKIMENAGFSGVNTKQEGEGLLPDIKLLEKRKSIIVEAFKHKS